MDFPAIGTAALLEMLSPFVPDAVIQEALPRRLGGRQAEWSSAQLLRVLLLQLLTPSRSANLLCQLLPEQRAWRRFAHLPNLRHLPNPRQLHEFRSRLTPSVLRGFNAVLLQRVMTTWPTGCPGVALVDSTDLPAATAGYKKSPGHPFPPGKRPSVDAPSRPGARVTSSVIKSTPSASGSPTMRRLGCSCR